MKSGLLCVGCDTRRNHIEIEEEQRRKHTKRKFGVKVQRTNANKMKKTLEEDLAIAMDDEGQGSDLEIIEYPCQGQGQGLGQGQGQQQSNISKLLERDTYDFTRTISPLSKMMNKVVVNNQIKKCDQFEQLNLTLEDDDENDGEESAIINNNNDNTILTNIEHNNHNNTNINSNNIINIGKEINTSNSKNVYQKKMVAAVKSSNNNANNVNANANVNVSPNINTNVIDDKNDISISLFSNVSGANLPKENNYNINKKLFSQLKVKTPVKEKHNREEKTDTQGNKGKDTPRNKNNTNSTIEQENNMKLIENYQKLKQLEQLQQLKDLEKMKELIELNNTVNKLNSMNNIHSINNNNNNNIHPMYSMPSMQPIPQLPQMAPMTLPYPNTLITGSTIPTSPNNAHIQMTNGYGQPNLTTMAMTDYNSNNTISTNTEPNVNVNIIANSNKPCIEPQSCKYCEEIYQYTIMNNLPLKAITCLYCNTVMNSKTLEYYLIKYKKDLELKYKNNISPTKEKINEEEDNEDNDSQDDNNNEENEEEFQRERERERKKIRDQERELLKAKRSTKSAKPPRNIRALQERKNNKANTVNNDIKDYVNNNNNNNANANEQIELLDNDQGNISLAEAFRSKRAKILNNIEKRSNSVKDNVLMQSSTTTANEPLEMKIIRERRNQKQKLPYSNDVNLTTPDIKSNSQSMNMSITTRSKADPSPELMNRLIKGEKAKMSNKEMKELNNRLYNKLVDVRAVKEDNSKKDELNRLSIVKKKYTSTLKEKVVKSFNNKKPH